MSSTAEDLEGKTLCVIGAGSIGQEIGKKAKAFDMNVIGLKRHRNLWHSLMKSGETTGSAKRWACGLRCACNADDAGNVSPDGSGAVSNDEGNSRIHQRFPGGHRRRGRPDFRAEGSPIGGAVLDVFHREPLPQDSPLWSMEQVLVTPHNSGLTGNTVRKVVEITRENIRRFREGRDLINQIENGRY
jgi:lactate dehydrogenase-like 2-hydroxyacid dehydrogenase